MTIFSALSKSSGRVDVYKHGRVVKAPLSWRLRNWLTWRFISGLLITYAAKGFTNATALFGTRIITITAELRVFVRHFYDDAEREYFVRLRREGRIEEAEAYAASRTYIEDYGVVSYRVVTDAFVAAIVDDLDNGGAEVSNFNYHGIGTGSTAEAAGDTALVTESTTALNPDNTRATGTRSQPASNQFRSSGTLTADAQIIMREHGWFNQAATGGGILGDRSVTSTTTIEIGENVTTQYTITFNSGG